MKRLFIFLILFLLSFSYTQAADVNLYLFSSDSCPHCKAERSFLDSIYENYPNLTIYDFEVSKNQNNVRAFQIAEETLGANVNGVPFTVIGGEYFIGFGEGTTDVLIEEKIKECVANTCEDPVGVALGIVKETESIERETVSMEEKAEPETETDKTFNVPFLGEISARTVSIPLLTLVLGFVDGFNPCAMWVLLFLISMLIGMENKRRRWILGSTFIFVSALVYFVFMSLWLNLILFLGFIFAIRIIIGLVAIVGGVYSVKKGLDSTSGCSVTGEEKRVKILNKMKEVVHQKSFWLSMFGITILAFSVNLVELICSAGLPAVYTQVLAINNLAVWQYYAYIALYVFIFMLDDLIVFILAMKTLEITGLTTKYSKITRIIGGVIMLIIGILLIFRPELIMFG